MSSRCLFNNAYSQESREPNFLRTVVFSTAFKPVTRLKFGVYNVINKAKSDVSLQFIFKSLSSDKTIVTETIKDDSHFFRRLGLYHLLRYLHI